MRVRVKSATFGKATLNDKKGEQVAAPTEKLLVWAEVQNTSKVKAREYRRWLPSPDGDCVLKTEFGRLVLGLRWPGVLSLEYPGPYKRPLPVGAAPVQDVIAFDLSRADSAALRLRLDASRVGEVGCSPSGSPTWRCRSSSSAAGHCRPARRAEEVPDAPPASPLCRIRSPGGGSCF